MMSTSLENNMTAENLENDPWAQYLNIESEDSLISTKDIAVENLYSTKISSQYHCPESAKIIHSALHQSNRELKYPDDVNSSKANRKEGKSGQRNKRLHDIAPCTSNKSVENNTISVEKPDPVETSFSGPGKKISANSNFCDITALTSATNTSLLETEPCSASYQALTGPKGNMLQKETEQNDTEIKSIVNAHSNRLGSYDENDNLATSQKMDQIEGLCINGTGLPQTTGKKVEKQSLNLTGSDNLSALDNENIEDDVECVISNFSRANIDHNTSNVDPTKQNKQLCSPSLNDSSTDRKTENNAYLSPIFSESSSLEKDSPTSSKPDGVGLNLHSSNAGHSQTKSCTSESTCQDDLMKTSSPLSFSNKNERTLDESCSEQKHACAYRFSADGEGCCDTDKNDLVPLEIIPENVSVQNKQRFVCATKGECNKLNSIESVFEEGNLRENSKVKHSSDKPEVGTRKVSQIFSTPTGENIPEKQNLSSENLRSPKRMKLDFHQSDLISLDNLNKCRDIEVQSDKNLEVDSNWLPKQSSGLPSKEPVTNFFMLPKEGRAKKLFTPVQIRDALRDYCLQYRKNVLNTEHSGNNPKLQNSAVFCTSESSTPEMRGNVKLYSARYQALTDPKGNMLQKETEQNDTEIKSIVNAHSNRLGSYDENDNLATSQKMDQIEGLCINGTGLPQTTGKKVEKQSLNLTGSDNLSALDNENIEDDVECVISNFSRANIDHNTSNVDPTKQNKQLCSPSLNDSSTDRKTENNAYLSPIFSESSSLEKDSPTSSKPDGVGLNLHSSNAGHSQTKSCTSESTCQDDLMKTSSPLSFSNKNERTLDESCSEQKHACAYRFSADGEGCCDTDKNDLVPLEIIPENVSVQNKQRFVCATKGECNKLNSIESVFEEGNLRENSKVKHSSDKPEVGTHKVSQIFSTPTGENIPEKQNLSSENLRSPKRMKLDFHQSDLISLDNLNKCRDIEVQSDKNLEVDSNWLPKQSSGLPSKEPVTNFFMLPKEGRAKKLFTPVQIRDALRDYCLQYTKNVLNTEHSGNNPKLQNSAVFSTSESSILEMRGNVSK